MIALCLMSAEAFDEAVPEPTPDRAWTVVCAIAVVACHLYPFIWLAVAA